MTATCIATMLRTSSRQSTSSVGAALALSTLDATRAEPSVAAVQYSVGRRAEGGDRSGMAGFSICCDQCGASCAWRALVGEDEGPATACSSTSRPHGPPVGSSPSAILVSLPTRHNASQPQVSLLSGTAHDITGAHDAHDILGTRDADKPGGLEGITSTGTAPVGGTLLT